jgi:hypothetical protein
MYGTILHSFSLHLTRDEFEQLGNQISAAECLQILDDIQRMQNNTNDGYE